MQVSQLQLLQDEQQVLHQHQKGLLEEEIGRLRQAVQQGNRHVQLARNESKVVLKTAYHASLGTAF